jgi:carboxylesterase
MNKEKFYKNGPVGCLLIHGFTGSPNELLELGEFLASKKLTVYIPTLPGHGTHSGDLFNYTWRDWVDAVKTAYHELKAICEEVFVCGLSMGGALALHLAAHEPSVKGVVTLSAAIQFPGWKKLAVNGLKRVIKFRHKKNGEDVRDTSTRPRLGSYRRYPYFAVDQLFELLEHVRGDLPEVTQPILIIHSRKDNTIPFSNSEKIYRLVGSTDKRKVDLQESYHIISVDVEKERVREEVFGFIQHHSQLLISRTALKLETKIS